MASSESEQATGFVERGTACYSTGISGDASWPAGHNAEEVALWEIRFATLAFFPRPGVSRIYGVGTHPMAAVPILPKYSRPLVSVTLVTGP